MMLSERVVLPFSPRLLSSPSSSSSNNNSPSQFRRRSSARSFLSTAPLLPQSPTHSASTSRPRPRHLFHQILKVASITLVLSGFIYCLSSFNSVRFRHPKVARASNNITFTQYLNSHFPLDLPKHESPHVWISLADYQFTATGAANLDVFFKQLNVERRAQYRSTGKEVRDSVLVTLCLDEGCADECVKREMYCYEGFESRRPAMIRQATWPKLASLIETLPQRDVFFIDADVSFRQDPYPFLEPLMEIHDVLAQENLVYNHINSGFLWMKKSAVMARAWQSVLEMDLIADSRDQFNLNTVLETSVRRLEKGAELGDETPLLNDFTASNGLSIHILDQRLFRVMHLQEQSPVFERHDSLIHHMTCADDKWVKLYIAKALGYWSDVDEYYTRPPPLLSIEHPAGTGSEVTHYFKLLFAAAHYTGRAIVPPAFVTISDVPDTPPLSRHSPSTFPLAHLETAFGIKILEPTYVEHSQSQLLGQSSLDPRKGRDDKKWNAVSKKEKQRRRNTAVSLSRPSEVDLRNYRTFYSLVNRLLQPDLASSPQIRFVNADRAPFWGTWRLDELPVHYLRPCELLQEPWRCDEFCRGVEELKRGPIDEEWPQLRDIDW